MPAPPGSSARGTSPPCWYLPHTPPAGRWAQAAAPPRPAARQRRWRRAAEVRAAAALAAPAAAAGAGPQPAPQAGAEGEAARQWWARRWTWMPASTESSHIGISELRQATATFPASPSAPGEGPTGAPAWLVPFPAAMGQQAPSGDGRPAADMSGHHHVSFHP